jgi:predicted metal-dependent peptidase
MSKTTEQPSTEIATVTEMTPPNERVTMSYFEDGVIELLHAQPFYAFFLMRMRRIPTTKIPTAGISVTDGINLYYNEAFFKEIFTKCGRKGIAAILQHEADHLLFMHMGSTRSKGMNKQMANIAMDCSINQYNTGIEALGMAVTLETFRKQFNPAAEPLQNFEYYYNLIQQDVQNNPDKYQNGGGMPDQFDDHDVWEESVPQEVAETIAKHHINAAANAVGRGKMPSHVAKAIGIYDKKVLPWGPIFRNFVANSTEMMVEPTRKKANRRYGHAQPGYRVFPKVHIAAVIDTSGSMSDRDLDAIFVELAMMYKQGVTVTVIECDSQVHNTWEYKGKNDVEVHGRGGTTFQPGLDAAAATGADCIVYFTDGDGESDFKMPKIPTLWVLNREGHAGSLTSKHKKIWMTV